MSGHLTRDILERHRLRALSAAELLAVDNHLAECAECRAAAGRRAPGEAQERLVRAALGDALHLSEDELERLASGQASDAEVARAGVHVEFCDRCRTALDDLRQTQAAIDLNSLEPVRLPSRPAGKLSWSLALAGPVAVLSLIVGLQYGARQASMRMVALERDLRITRSRLVSAGDSLRLAERRASEAEVAAAAATANARDARARVEGLRREMASNRSSVGRDQRSISRIAVAMASDPARAKAEVHLSLGLLGEAGPRTRGAGGPSYPVCEAVVSRRPVLRWFDSSTDCEHGVEVLAGDRVVATATVGPEAGHWSVNPPLSRGQRYTWKVQRLPESGDETPSDSGKASAAFRVLSRDEATAVLTARILAAMEAARAGLITEARTDLLQAALDGEDLPIAELARKLAHAIIRASQDVREPASDNPRE